MYLIVNNMTDPAEVDWVNSLVISIPVIAIEILSFIPAACENQ
jgi:hypothetical protein